MEVTRVFCGVVLVALMVTGSNAQLDVCGTAPLNTRIVGGADAPAGSWPWQVSLHWGGNLACGGSLINNQWVMTAAQCTRGLIKPGFTVYLGRDKEQGTNPNEAMRNVSKIIQHPQYNTLNLDNDISLLQLSSPVTFTNYIRPVCLAAAGSKFEDGTTFWVTGWGRIKTNTDLPSPGTLQEVSVPIVSNSECKKVYATVTDNQMCAGPHGGGKGSCLGDAGGPLVRKIDSRWVQAGMVSFITKDGCAQPNQPGGYARVSQFQSWINSQITSNQPGFVYSGTAHPVSLSVPLLLSILLVLFSVFV